MTMPSEEFIVSKADKILVTGAAGFIGSRVVEDLLSRGFTNIRCLVRKTSNMVDLKEVIARYEGGQGVEFFTGNLLSREDCLRMTEDVLVIYHLAAGTGTKSFSDAFLNSVVTTRNLLDGALGRKSIRRFVNVSSFAVYTNRHNTKRGVLDETCPVENDPGSRDEAYCYGKVKQDELVMSYGRDAGLPYVILRPGSVYGPGKVFVPGRVGMDSLGFFLHFGGPNCVPFSYVDNCASAIVLAGLRKGIDGQVFNVVDDDLPSSRRYLRLYKNNVRKFRSIYVPHAISWLFCLAWERGSAWSKGQVPAAFSRRKWSAYWKRTRYSNAKLKDVLGWRQGVSTEEGLARYFESCRVPRS